MQNSNWIVVTGASSGIGLQTSKLLLSKGFSIIATGRNEKKLIETFKNEKESVVVLPWDLSEVETIKDYAGTVNQRIGPITGLVHCAGIQKTTPIHLNKYRDLLKMFEINTFAGMQLVSNFSKKDMFKKNESSFILISSLAAHEGAFGKSMYGASKGALEGFLKPAAAELAEKGIRLNAVAPGVVKTEMVEDYFKQLSDEQIEKTWNDYPLGFGESIDVANMIEFLLSNKSRWITGQIFKIDGGHLSRKA